MILVRHYEPTEEERLESLLGHPLGNERVFAGHVCAESILLEMNIDTFRVDEPGWPVWAMDRTTKQCRPATEFEARMHVLAVNDYHAMEAACGVI